MYRVSPLLSTPVANSSRPDRGLSGELSPTCIFPSFACDFLDGDSSFECCSIDPLTGSQYVCRRSPRLLTNGYYIWTEDSFLCDADGHITLNPCHTSVMYKENLVRIFRKKKRTHRPLSSLLDPRASKSWLHGSIVGNVDSPPSEDLWLEGIRSLDERILCLLGLSSSNPVSSCMETPFLISCNSFFSLGILQFLRTPTNCNLECVPGADFCLLFVNIFVSKPVQSALSQVLAKEQGGDTKLWVVSRRPSKAEPGEFLTFKPGESNQWLLLSQGNDLDYSLSDGWETQTPITDTSEASSSGHILPQPFRESSQKSSLQPQMKVLGHFQKTISVHSRAALMHKVSFQAILLAVCLIISACARWFMGGELARIFTCALMFTIAYIVKSLFLNVASYFKATT